MRRGRALLVSLAVAGASLSLAPEAGAQVAPPPECAGEVGYPCARALILKYLGGADCIVDVGPDHPVCAEPVTGPSVKVPKAPVVNLAPPLPPECWERTDYACARAYVLEIVGGECLVDVGPEHPVCVEPQDVDVPKLTLPPASAACLNPLTCVPPFDNLGIPRVPAPVAQAGGATRPYYRPPPLNCDPRDYITHLRSLYLASDDIPAIVNATPADAVRGYLLSPALPPGPAGADWALHQPSAKPDQVYFVTRSPLNQSRILGVMGIERINTSWEVYFLTACGEYLYPGSLIVDEHLGDAR
jgi:hypothetical protein